jgi:antitoxin component YwqK of YwqJK toxin-antitoxin module
MTEPTRIDIDDLDVDLDQGMRLLYRGEPFTGEVMEHLGGALVSLENYEDGLVHGPSWEWYEDGTLRSEGTARRARAVGVWREWHPNGKLACERVFTEDGLARLSVQEWDASGQPTKVRRKDDERRQA